MGTCSVGVGSAAKIAVAFNSNSWGGGAASLGGGDRIPFISEAVAKDPNAVQDPTIDGSGWQSHDLRLGMRHAGPIDVKGDYNHILRLMAYAMGTAGTPTTTEAGFRYTHQLKLDPNLCGVAFTLGIDRVVNTAGAGTSAWIGDHAKVGSMVLNLGGAEFMRAQFNTLVRSFSDGQDPSTWDYATGAEAPQDNQDILGLDSVWRINAQSSSALDTGDVIDRPSTATLTMERNLGGSLLQGSSGSAVIDEPVPTALPSCRLQLEFENYSSGLHAIFVDADDAQTKLKADITYTGGSLGAGNYSMTIRIPNLLVTRSNANVASPGRIPLTAECTMASVNTGDVLGMTDLDAPFDVTIVNLTTSDPLS